MTPKEQLEQIKIAHIEAHIESKNEGDFDVWFEDYYEEIEQALTELEALKKPPAVEEVCMELSRHYKEQVSYSNERHNHHFYFEKYRLGIVMLLHENIKFIQGDFHKTNELPPHLITLIGKFYESLEGEKNE